jgi:hypothetical protein
MSRTLIHTVFALAFGSITLTTHAATLNNGDILTINPGVYSYDINGNNTNATSGSWAAFDVNGTGTINGTEKYALSPGYLGGIIIGITTSPGASHTGLPTLVDLNAIDAPWALNGFNTTGSDYLATPISGDTTNGLNMSGWSAAFNAKYDFSLGGGAWGAGFLDGMANFTWDGIAGDSYVLDYHATVPAGTPDSWGTTLYALHLEGVVQVQIPVPEASTYGMMLAGLGLIGLQRRRNVRLHNTYA